jgi:mannose/fructose-specific phosphotransferase system component IIA
MAVGILLITHEGIGSALLAVTTRLLRNLPLACEAFEVPFDGDRTHCCRRRPPRCDGSMAGTACWY